MTIPILSLFDNLSSGGQGGIGEVTDINTGGRLIKWIAGTGALTGITSWLAKFWRDMGD